MKIYPSILTKVPRFTHLLHQVRAKTKYILLSIEILRYEVKSRKIKANFEVSFVKFENCVVEALINQRWRRPLVD